MDSFYRLSLKIANTGEICTHKFVVSNFENILDKAKQEAAKFGLNEILSVERLPNCLGCQDNLANQDAHMEEPYGCLCLSLYDQIRINQSFIDPVPSNPFTVVTTDTSIDGNLQKEDRTFAGSLKLRRTNNDNKLYVSSE